LLQNYHWPGNIRSLENVLEHAFVLCHTKIIQTECLPERLWYIEEKKDSFSDIDTDVDTTKNPLENAEKLLIQNLLKKFDGHRGKTAEALKINKATLWRKMKKYKLL
jgi:transcriptional regulator with PAS, ATPase and Fis domain